MQTKIMQNPLFRMPVFGMLWLAVLGGGDHTDLWAGGPTAETTDKAVEIVIDGSVRREPISPLIYSQFIEHLGRCIYGGIWAEMLEDRKFLEPVGGDASVWKTVAGKGRVDMETNDPFVGKQSPRMSAGVTERSGILQGGLGLEQEQSYSGYIWLKVVSGNPVVQVRLIWGEEIGDRTELQFGDLATDFGKYPLVFTSGKDTDQGRIEVTVRGGSCVIGTISLMPADNVQGMRVDTLRLLKELGAPLYRWPGGNFVSGYDWRDGIGDRDHRPPRRNPAWKGIEHNDFGLDEFIVFCRAVDAEPLIVVNTGFGGAYSAAQEVEYANGDTESIGGGWRAKNGHSDPYHVKWWGVGNEMYGRWQLGHTALRFYTRKHNLVVDAMRQVDPSIQVVGVGALGNRDPHDPDEKRGWTRGMLEQCADRMDLISEHFYCGTRKNLLEHIRQIPDQIRAKAEGHRKLREELPQLKDKDIRIAMDEWNYWHRPYVYGDLGCIYRLRDAMGIAAGIHEFARNTDVIAAANYAQTVNVIGCIKTTKTDAAFATTGLVLKLYRHRFGSIPIRIRGTDPTTGIDVVAALTKDGKNLTIGVVNPLANAQTLRVRCQDLHPQPEGIVWEITGEDPNAFNEPGKPPAVEIKQRAIQFGGQLEIGPFSISVFQIPLRAQ